MAKRGPKGPRLDIVTLEKLASIMCSRKEMAAFLGCDQSLLSKKNYSEIIEKAYEKGKISLRRKMLETALNGNVVMMIWLSKQYLGFTEKQVQTINTTQVDIDKVKTELDTAIATYAEHRSGKDNPKT